MLQKRGCVYACFGFYPGAMDRTNVVDRQKTRNGITYNIKTRPNAVILFILYKGIHKYYYMVAYYMHDITINMYNIILQVRAYNIRRGKSVEYYYHRRRRSYYYYYLLLSYNTTPPGVAADKQHLRTMDAKSSEIMCPHV